MRQDTPFVIHTLALGPMDNFIYLIEDKASRRAAVVDPAWDVAAIIERAQGLGLRISDILLTHSHHDHINGVEALLEHSDPQLHLLRAEAAFWGAGLEKPTLHEGGDRIHIGDTEISILHTPGHTPGSACYHLGDQVLTGDTVFVFGCGRCDLRGGDPEQMYTSLRRIRDELPAQTVIRPGHDYGITPVSTVAEQVEGNPFFHHHHCADFVEYRMHLHDRDEPYTPVQKPV